MNYLDVGVALLLEGEFGQGPDAVGQLDGLVDDRLALLAPPRRHREHVLDMDSLFSYLMKGWVITEAYIPPETSKLRKSKA